MGPARSLLFLRPAAILVAALALVPYAVQAACTAGQPVSGAPETTPSTDFLVMPDGFVANPKTGLIWKRCAEGQTWDGGSSACTGAALSFDWGGALTRAANATDGGSGQWRLPNRNELASLVEFCGHSPAINGAIFPGTPAARFWSSTTFETEPARAWDVYFSDGYLGASPKGDFQHVRLVRSLTGGDFPLPQTLSLGDAPTLQANGSGNLSGITSSGLPITFTSLTPTICTVSGNVVSGVAAGQCTIQAEAGDSDFALQSVTFSFPIAPASSHPVATVAIPTLSEWMLLLLTVLVGGVGVFHSRRRSAKP